MSLHSRILTLMREIAESEIFLIARFSRDHFILSILARKLH